MDEIWERFRHGWMEMCAFVLVAPVQRVTKGSWLGPLTRIIEMAEKGGGADGHTHFVARGGGLFMHHGGLGAYKIVSYVQDSCGKEGGNTHIISLGPHSPHTFKIPRSHKKYYNIPDKDNGLTPVRALYPSIFLI